ncbi:MAG: Aspartyl/glutamyl-tRNA(Asn/Gln) amidotransferase subunit B [Chlamydiales bacterium]|nr:Aspartyl/glutamyl-tRNA(Asn/Gln) amidotransferase subunit B [Chlamydiales bacterium]MCH9635794.1 Aspartyl/glutamyl-tRNA(Asn/Gln) amidotransferase subunit B [Chlamydiales bacterium]MCH9704362.1 Asp-tRNA(Asn)/Glu-tRNA(Gln) amidotransferase subunit GatB [Chlamydiota bacterium]
MDEATYKEWELVVGLEIHVELNTKSKLFSSAPNRFGDEPNSNISDVCTGQPGTLPVLNQAAVRKAIAFGCAVNGDVAHYSRFDRKSYFYPDSPRNFQITQFERPIIRGGEVTADVAGKPMTFQIHQAHLEDDAGMLKHFSKFAGVDYNRAGVPLVEIVSEPCLHSAEEAVAYATAVKAILQYVDASDCNMEEGSLRMDANISVRPKGSDQLRNKTEIKNMNSFNYLAMAIEAEARRQVRFYVQHPDKEVETVTFRWDAERKETVLMRRKETADDYRYFLEPDLPPLILEAEYIDSIRESLPELPYAREKRYIEELKVAHDAAVILVNEKKLADYFEVGLEHTKSAKSLANWLTIEFAGRLKESGQNIWDCGIEAAHVALLVHMIEEGTVTGRIAKQVADLMVQTPGKNPADIVKENPDFQPVSDEGELEKIVDQVLADNEQSVADYKAGKEKAFAFLVGQVMKATRGKASPPIVNKLLKKKI